MSLFSFFKAEEKYGKLDPKKALIEETKYCKLYYMNNAVLESFKNSVKAIRKINKDYWYDHVCDAGIKVISDYLQVPVSTQADIHIHEVNSRVNEIYKELYDEEVNYKAFFAMAYDSIHISLEDLTPKVLIHELTHSIVSNYFDKYVPYNMHEILAVITTNKLCRGKK